jgi:predicted phage baseplate assembly protein
MRASGGADREGRDQARKNVPLAVLALDRLVSTRDYANLARTFAGIGKASAARLSDGRHQLVHVTIAGADDIPIDESSDLHRNLVKALRNYGDPYLPLMVEVRELMLIVLSANVRIQPDYQWESVVTKIRAKLLDTFSFERRELGQDVLLSEVISATQSVQGVAYVDVDMLGGVSEKDETGALRTPKEIADEVQRMIKSQEKGPKPRVPVSLATVKDGIIRPAQLAYLTPDVEATCILNEVKS